MWREVENVGSGLSIRRRGEGLIFVISSPSGGGKTTLLRKVMEQVSGLRFSVSYTTRSPRCGEEDGKDYHFVSPTVFRRMVERGEFLEWAEVLGNHYGTALHNLDKLQVENTDLLLDVDTQGAKHVMERMNQAVLIFVLPPSPQVLRERLLRRGLDSPETIEFRLASAMREIREAHWYRYTIVNDQMEEAVEELKAIILAERCRKRRDSVLNQKIKEWEEVHGKNYGRGLFDKGGKPI